MFGADRYDCTVGCNYAIRSRLCISGLRMLRNVSSMTPGSISTDSIDGGSKDPICASSSDVRASVYRMGAALRCRVLEWRWHPCLFASILSGLNCWIDVLTCIRCFSALAIAGAFSGSSAAARYCCNHRSSISGAVESYSSSPRSSFL